jgi:hypothetical protein
MHKQVTAAAQRRYAALQVPPQHAWQVMELLLMDESLALIAVEEQKILDLLNDKKQIAESAALAAKAAHPRC